MEFPTQSGPLSVSVGIRGSISFGFSILEDNSKAKEIFPTELALSYLYGCEENYYDDYLEDFIETLTELKPMVEQMLEDLNSSDDVIRYEYDCWY